LKTILQFGTGRFLRAFVDLFVTEVNAGTDAFAVVAVQSTGGDRAALLENGPFHVAIRGLEEGETVDRVERVDSVQRAVSTSEDWSSVIGVARDPSLTLVVSNTTEAGLALAVEDADQQSVPVSYPAKLLRVLLARHEADFPPVSILPCELVDRNADVLRGLVLEQAARWKIDQGAADWVADAVPWCNTLVDRIVSAPPADHPLLKEDPLLAVAEPFAFWAVAAEEIPMDHPAIEAVPDISPYVVRKVRLLNGAHTALVERYLGTFETVRQALADEDAREWLMALVMEEILPCVEDRVEGAEAFARDVFDRFANPFLDHRLEDIGLHQAAKIKVRLMPSYHDYRERFGRSPRLLADILQPHL